MSAPPKKQPTSANLQGAQKAIQRAAKRAREIAIQTNTPCVVRVDGVLIDSIAPTTSTERKDRL